MNFKWLYAQEMTHGKTFHSRAIPGLIKCDKENIVKLITLVSDKRLVYVTFIEKIALSICNLVYMYEIKASKLDTIIFRNTQ